MSRPALALEAHPDSPWHWEKYRDRCRVIGPWRQFERAAETAIQEQLDEVLFMVPFAGEMWSAVCGESNAMYLAPFVDREAWAKVRVTVSVEVLDGLP